MKEAAISETTLPPGDYWIGDPCYAFDDHSVWMKLLESADYETNPTILEAKAAGREFIASGTAFGDGEYQDQYGNRYPVDAGLLGATPAIAGREIPFGMRLVVFDSPVDVEFDDGDVKIGHIVIETDPKPECEDCGEKIDLGEFLCYHCEDVRERLEAEESD